MFAIVLPGQSFARLLFRYLLVLMLAGVIPQAFAAAEPPADGNDWAIVDETGAGQYTTIEVALAAAEKYIFIRKGTYTTSVSLQIVVEGTQFIGESKDDVVIDVTPGLCADILNIDADHVTVAEITVRQTPSCSWTAIVNGGRSHTTVQNTIVHGSDTKFAIFYAGPEHAFGQEPLDLVENNELDDGNRILNNEIHSNFAGDVLSFSLQKNGLVSGNTIHGGLIAVFLDRDVIIENNTLISPNGHGIFLSLPSYNVTIRNNTITDSAASAIKVARQSDHHDGATQADHGESLTLTSHRSKDILITGNAVENARGNAIEINNLADSSITHNVIKSSDFSGIYVLRSDRLYIAYNEITDAAMVEAGVRATSHPGWTPNWDSGIYFDQLVTESSVSGNTINSDGYEMQFGIAINPYNEGNTRNEIVRNELLGEIEFTTHSGAADADNTESDNQQTTRTGRDLSLDVAQGQGKVTHSATNTECSSFCTIPTGVEASHTFSAEPAEGYHFSGWISPASCVGRGAVSCVATNESYLDIVAAFTTTPGAVVVVDTDPATETEEQGPSGTDVNYDGNGDSIPDRQQSDVISKTFGEHYLTIELEQNYDAATTKTELIANPAQETVPDGVTFPIGILDIDVPVDGSGHAVVEIHLPDDVTATDYYKYTPTPDNPVAHWYSFMYDGTTGAIFDGNKITLHFQDGQRGDEDLSANNQIDDQGGPVVMAMGAGTVGTQNIPVFGPFGLFALLAGLLWFGNRQRIT